MDILAVVKEAWGWVGLAPQEVVVENEFGNLILKDVDNRFWRLCPEDAYCNIVADSIEAYNALIQEEAFVQDWFMSDMVQEAEQRLGKLEVGQKYCLATSGVLGGDYGGANLKIDDFEAIIRTAGALGQRIKDLPDGAKVKF